MSDLISREAVDDAIYDYSRSCAVDYAQIMEYIDKIPSVENKGEWILVVDSYYEDGTIKENHWECSKCGSGNSGWGEYKFCPDCGADMRGDDEEKDPWEYMDDIEREEAREYLESLQDIAEWEGGKE